jgi:hypothetical protein
VANNTTTKTQHKVSDQKEGYEVGEFNKFIDLTLRKSPPPSFIIIQLGSNDLGLTKSWQLFTDIECGLLRFRTLLPDVRIIWSDMLQRRYWHNATDGPFSKP